MQCVRDRCVCLEEMSVEPAVRVVAEQFRRQKRHEAAVRAAVLKHLLSAWLLEQAVDVACELVAKRVVRGLRIVLRLTSFPSSVVSLRHVVCCATIAVVGQTDRRRTMSSAQNGRRRRALSAEEKYQLWQQLLTGELSQRQAAER